jgi:hypothetical protein
LKGKKKEKSKQDQKKIFFLAWSLIFFHQKIHKITFLACVSFVNELKGIKSSHWCEIQGEKTVFLEKKTLWEKKFFFADVDWRNQSWRSIAWPLLL